MSCVLIFDMLCWISTQYPKFLAGQNDARVIFLEGQNGVFQNFYALKPGFTGQTWALLFLCIRHRKFVSTKTLIHPSINQSICRRKIPQVQLVVLRFNATLTAKVISYRWRACVSWLSHTSTNTNFFPKPPTTFFNCFSRGERRKNVPERNFASTELTTTRSWIRHAHNWATRAGSTYWFHYFTFLSVNALSLGKVETIQGFRDSSRDLLWPQILTLENH